MGTPARLRVAPSRSFGKSTSAYNDFSPDSSILTTMTAKSGHPPSHAVQVRVESHLQQAADLLASLSDQ